MSQNSSLSHGSGCHEFMRVNMHGLCMHDNSLVVHDNNMWCTGAQEFMFCTCNTGVQRGTKAPSTSTRIRSRRSAVDKHASPQQTSHKVACRGVGRPFEQPRDDIFLKRRKL